MRGINKLLEEAAKDVNFSNALLIDRRAAVMAKGIQLTEAELAVLQSVDTRTLGLMIQSVRAAPTRPVQQSPGLITGIMPDRPDRSFGISPDRPGPPVDPWKPPRKENF